jgi:hypothetical protein
MLTRFQSVLNDDSLVNRSVDYGKRIASQIFEWSKTDGGHRGYLKNFDKKMEIRKGPGFWQPPLYAQSFSHFPLHPHWGKNRTFLVSDSMMEAPVPLPYDTIPGSPYYEQFRMVYEKRKNLSDTEKEAALWWGDDPDLSFTPPGHSYSLGSIAIKKAKPDLITCAETYARIGIAVADAIPIYRLTWIQNGNLSGPTLLFRHFLQAMPYRQLPLLRY